MRRHHQHGHVNFSTKLLTISLSSYLKGVVTTVRSFSFVLAFFALLLCTLFPVAQIGWSINIAYGSTGDSGSGEACEFSDAMETTDSEDDSPQEALEDCVDSRMSVSDCESSRTHALINEIPPLTLLVSRLLHPPTAKG
jgi:hypothetical protein